MTYQWVLYQNMWRILPLASFRLLDSHVQLPVVNHPNHPRSFKKKTDKGPFSSGQ